MIVNLEGVMLAEPPPGLGMDLHAFRTDVAAPLLRGFNIRAASLANNHSYDLGAGGIRETIASLRSLNIQPIKHMGVVDFNAFRLVALNYIGVRSLTSRLVMRDRDVARLCGMALKPPVVAFVHWGEEYTSEPGPDVMREAEKLHNCGVGLIIGAHSHQAAKQTVAVRGGEFAMLYSLGNLLFDQRPLRASSAIVELRKFDQGTFAIRLLSAPNLFEIADPLKNASPPEFN
jgi:poly-gamma-glutamate synthesis protein (capsule biosynthesis protein)